MQCHPSYQSNPDVHEIFIIREILYRCPKTFYTLFFIFTTFYFNYLYLKAFYILKKCVKCT